MSRKVYISSDTGMDEAVFAVAEENPYAALLWPWLLTAFDDWGRGEANAHKLKSRIFPDWPGLSRNDLEVAIQLFAKHGLIALYEVAGKRYMAIEFENWKRYQTHIRYDRKGNSRSQIPEPPANDHIPALPGTSGNIPDKPGASRRIPPSPSPSPSPSPTDITYGAPQSDAPPVENSEDEDAFADVDFGDDDPGEAEDAADNHTPAQQLVAFYVDERTKAGSKPTDRQRGIVADVIGQKVRGGSKPEIVREAIRRMVRKGKPPSTLPAFVDEVEAERHVMRPRSTVPDYHEPTSEERAASLEAARKAREQVEALARGIGRAMP